MSKISYNLRLLCNLQGNLFANYHELCFCSPYIFIRRFMNSNLAKRFDDQTILLEQSSTQSQVEELNEEYGTTSFGNPKTVDQECLFWVGYIYRYWANSRNIPSRYLIHKVKPDKLISRYNIYHSMDLDYAIDLIIEEEGLSFSEINQNKDLMQVINDYLDYLKDNKK